MELLQRIAELLSEPRYVSLLAEGIRNTLILTAASFTMGFALGTLIAIGRLYGPRPLRWLLAGYVELIRGTPMLLQLFILYYALPQAGISLAAMTAAILGMGLNSAAYQSEYLRASLRAVHTGQWEAALALGMTRWQAITSIILPIGLRTAIPALTNELVYLLKYSSIAYFLAVVELVYAGKIIGSETFAYLEVYTIIALVYLAFSLAITRTMKRLEKKVAIPGLAVSAAERLQ
ncbi:amino acid ABC transporter permease [Hyperthermus butylicus]|uniref:Glutamine transport system permease protein glnP n=1 Tax=Hyperthermus butylicus (strain DSM 5456 / JCM 9403 / PLM1-5) TaxID=415426 RepID=A2BKN3_HYPBU|nr:amino acid ABC transporter permease [Hyperthermus butylicus]ABM80544.1 glutamine transport system permease protein glnP [Hyperthermus butylicus DSM 5456]